MESKKLPMIFCWCFGWFVELDSVHKYHIFLNRNSVIPTCVSLEATTVEVKSLTAQATVQQETTVCALNGCKHRELDERGNNLRRR